MLKSSQIVLKNFNNVKPSIAVILGSGLTNFFKNKEILRSISYTSLPDFVKPTVKGHSGKFVLGSIFNKNVICMYGRSHIYEGHNPQSLAAPIRVLKDIGSKLLIVTNAAGSLDENMPTMTQADRCFSGFPLFILYFIKAPKIKLYYLSYC